MRLREFLNESNWCTGWYARDSRGNDCHALSEDATRWCLMGAILKCYSEDSDERWQVINRFASLVRVLHGQRLNDFNDEADWDDVEHILMTVDA